MHTSLVTTCMINSDRSQEKNQIDTLNKFSIHSIFMIWRQTICEFAKLLIWKGNVGGKTFLK